MLWRKKGQEKTDRLEHGNRSLQRKKIKECQRLQNQINFQTNQPIATVSSQRKLGISKKGNGASINTDIDIKPPPSAAETDSDGVTKGQVCEVTKETADKTEKYNKGKRLLRDEKTKFNKYRKTKINGLTSHLENFSREKELKRSLENQAERTMEGQNSESSEDLTVSQHLLRAKWSCCCSAEYTASSAVW
ncbi:hypothetical protein GH733_004618 [Mirounga leonina]|nr:hypothetical protein GH733_004831 [Mirounga leonina]KAF3828712.1 hypothetical protein GH733_004618 [Mirounga leonina]